MIGYPELPYGADATLTGGRAATGTGEGSDILPADQTNELILWQGGGPLWLLCWFHRLFGLAVHCTRSRHHTVSYLDSC